MLFLQELSAARARALDECAEARPFRALHGLGLRGMSVLSPRRLADVRLVDLPATTCSCAGSSRAPPA